METPERPDVTLVGGDGGNEPSGPTRLESPTDSETVPPGRYKLVKADSGEVLEVAGGDEADGADVRLGADGDANHQRWDLRYDGAGTYELTAAHSGKALDVFERSTDPGANVVQWTVTGNANQRFHVDPFGSGAYRLVAASSGLVLGTDDAGSAVQAGWTGESSQRWQLIPVTDRTGGAGPITVEGGGADIWSQSDAFHYYHATVSGDFDVAVRVDGVENTNEYAKAGLMVRESLSADATNAMIRRTPSETSVQWRESAGADTVSLTSGGGGHSEVAGGTTDHAWQRLVHSGDRVLAYGSDDGVEWTLLAEVSLSLSEEVRLGLAVTSHAEGTLCTAEFDSLGGVSPTGSDDVGDVSVAGSVDSGDSDEDTTPPSAPSNLAVEGSTTSSVDVSWNGASDDTGVAEYVVSVDGQRQTTVGGDTTSATVVGLDAGTTYQVGVRAVDAAGNESGPATVSAATSEDGGDLEPVAGTVPRDIDGDGKHDDFNANGRLDSDDVVVYFNNYDDPAVTNHTDAYDFNDSGRVDFDDIVELFNML